jgi:hypothetical protein
MNINVMGICNPAAGGSDLAALHFYTLSLTDLIIPFIFNVDLEMVSRLQRIRALIISFKKTDKKV